MILQNKRYNQYSAFHRNMRLLLICYGALVLSGAYATVHAQALSSDTSTSGFQLGVYTGAANDNASGSIPFIPGLSNSGELQKGQGTATMFGSSLAFPKAFSERAGLFLRFYGASVEGTHILQGGLPITATQKLDQSNVLLRREATLSWQMESVRLDILAQYRIWGNLIVGIGPWAGYRLSSRFVEQNGFLIDSLGTVADTSLFLIPQSPTRTYAIQPLSFGSMLRVAYPLEFGKRISIQPELTIHTDFLSPISGEAWQTLSVGGGVSVVLNIMRNLPEPVVERPEGIILSSRNSPQLSNTLRAGIDMHVLDAQERRLPSASITVYETVFRRHIPFPTDICFEHNSVTLAPAYMQDGGDSDSATNAELVFDSDIQDVRFHALDILGGRLSEHRDWIIRLVSIPADGEPDSIAQLRAIAVRGYLQEYWGVTNDRIKVHIASGNDVVPNLSTSPTCNSQPRIVLQSSVQEALAPIVLRSTEQEFERPKLQFVPDVQSTSGVRKQTISLIHEGIEIGRFDLDREGGKAPPELAWLVAGDMADGSVTSLSASLEVEDSTGAVVTAQSQIPLRIRRFHREVDRVDDRKGEPEQYIYTFYSFGDSYVDTGEDNIQLLNQIAAEATAGTRITVVGFHHPKTGGNGAIQNNSKIDDKMIEEVATDIRKYLEKKLNDQAKMNVTVEQVIQTDDGSRGIEGKRRVLVVVRPG